MQWPDSARRCFAQVKRSENIRLHVPPFLLSSLSPAGLQKSFLPKTRREVPDRRGHGHSLIGRPPGGSDEQSETAHWPATANQGERPERSGLCRRNWRFGFCTSFFPLLPTPWLYAETDASPRISRLCLCSGGYLGTFGSHSRQDSSGKALKKKKRNRSAGRI